jgi:hypothetical protein
VFDGHSYRIVHTESRDPINENPEYEGNVAVSEESSLLSPGSKVVLEFIMGDSDPYPMGTFYVDRSNFQLLGESVGVDGRNIIGKALGDQSFDEENVYPLQFLHQTLKDILDKANIIADEMLVQITSVTAGYQFDHKMRFLDGIMEVLKALDNWQIKELVDGTVVIGAATYAGFTPNTSYVFQRGRDVFSRSIVRDDQEAYRRVCVHNKDFSIAVYRTSRHTPGGTCKETRLSTSTCRKGLRWSMPRTTPPRSRMGSSMSEKSKASPDHSDPSLCWVMKQGLLTVPEPRALG